MAKGVRGRYYRLHLTDIRRQAYEMYSAGRDVQINSTGSRIVKTQEVRRRPRLPEEIREAAKAAVKAAEDAEKTTGEGGRRGHRRRSGKGSTRGRGTGPAYRGRT